MTEKTTCPCKYTSLRLSSPTAAEFGDLHRIMETTSRNSNNSNSMDTSLQLAAQHGHTAVTAYLLHHKTTPSVASLKTPLHRACFSGAVSTIRLILDFASSKQCLDDLLLAPDESFGDQRNALHKAAAGGRFLAVHCLLEYASDASTVLLTTKDARGQTAREIAVSSRLRQLEEAKSVARWNLVAGGPPDWDTCVQLLRRAEFRSYTRSSTSKRTTKKNWEPIAPHLVSMKGLSCADCSEPEEKCVTKRWEDSFRLTLGSEVETSLGHTLPTAGDLFCVPETNNRIERNQPETHHLVTPEPAKPSTDALIVSSNLTLGQKCSKCHNLAIALYRRNGLLVCRKCC